MVLLLGATRRKDTGGPVFIASAGANLVDGETKGNRGKPKHSFCPVLHARKAAPGSDCRCVRLDGFHLHNKKSNDDSVNVEQV